MPTIQEKVAEKISACGPTVNNAVVDKLAEVEISKRIDLITKGIAKQEALEKEFKKSHKADIAETYDEGGAVVVSAQYSKGKLDTIKKDKEKLSGLVKLLESCLDKNLQEDYNKLQETLNKLNNAGGSKDSSTTESKSEA